MNPDREGFWWHRDSGSKKWNLMYVQPGKKWRMEAKLYRGSNWRDADQLDGQWFPCFTPEEIKLFVVGILNCRSVREVAQNMNYFIAQCGLRIKSDLNKLALRIKNFSD